MNQQEIIKKTVAFVKERMSGEGTGHDWWHIERVWNNAKVINKKEKADQFIVDLAVLLHDVGDGKVIGKDIDDYSIARDFLKTNKVENSIVEAVMFIIENMSFSSSLNKKSLKLTKEFKVVQDADRLDALGAIGIARLFAYGGKKNRPLHDPTKKVLKIKSKLRYRKLNRSSFNHFYEKVLLLKDLMHTKTAKAIAVKRHQYVEEYIKQFLQEWEGKR